MKRGWLIALCLIWGTGGVLQADSTAPSTPAFQLTSSAFKDGGSIPPPYTCDGTNLSPALAWTDPPAGTQSLALIMQDPDAPAGTFTHWVVYNIPPTARSLPKSYSVVEHFRDGTWQGANDFGRIGYGGPCPPDPDHTHHYVFTLYALDKLLTSHRGYHAEDLGNVTVGHILAQTQLTGTYHRLY